ncbi:MAG: SAM hydrolase/SAM-dependent halogenase family protein [Cyclobacteriaceae bacterium]
MAIITLTTDFGESDHYVGAVKGKIASLNPGIQVVDITHEIEHFDLAHGSFVLRSVFREFPAGTVHLVAVDSIGPAETKFIAVKLEDHFFVCPDNGLLGLVSDKEADLVIELHDPNKQKSAFPARDIFTPAAVHLASGKDIHDLGKPLPEIKKMLGRVLRATKKQLTGHVVRVDHYGNLITNIEQEIFFKLKEDRKFKLVFGRENVSRIHQSIQDTSSGDCFVIFNSLGFLEIGINKGNAAQLLGLRFDTPVTVVFEE